MNLRIYDLTPPPVAAAEEPVLFSSLKLGRRPGGWALMSSVAVHALMVILLMGSEYMFYEDDVDWAQYRVEPLRLHLSEPLYFSAAAEPPKPAPRAVAQQSGRAAGANPGPATPSRGPLATHQLELPAPPEMAKNAPIIIQPDFRPQVAAPPSTLPPLAFWARQGPDLPKPPARREFVVPGRTEAPAAPPKLAAPPVPAIPNREQAVADINVALPPALTTPALPVPNSATMPVRVRSMLGAEAASFDRLSGQPANVIALATERSDARNVEIPKGLQNIPRSAAGDQTGAAASADGAPGASAGTRGTASAGSNQGAGVAGANPNASSAGRGQGSGWGASAPTETAVSPGSANAGAHPGTMPPMSANVVVRPVAPPEVTRIEHPSSGSFDVVIMQSGARDDLPDLGGMLTGNPVYTVYLRVGDQKEWLLEYCIPTRENNIQANPYQINVDDAGSITPPYPISTTIPNIILGQHIPKHILLHGFLTASGSLRNVKGPEINNALMSQIMAVLSEWQFRPALRNKKPIDIEILLVIPPRG